MALTCNDHDISNDPLFTSTTPTYSSKSYSHLIYVVTMQRILLHCYHCCKIFRKNQQEAHRLLILPLLRYYTSDSILWWWLFIMCSIGSCQLPQEEDGRIYLCIHLSHCVFTSQWYLISYRWQYHWTRFYRIKSNHNNQPYTDTMVNIEIDWSTFTGLNGSTHEHKGSKSSLPVASHCLTLPLELKLPKVSDMQIHSIALELMVYINDNLLSPSHFDFNMKWCRDCAICG